MGNARGKAIISTSYMQFKCKFY